jgi:subtilisin-like proprotein convertase family protein
MKILYKSLILVTVLGLINLSGSAQSNRSSELWKKTNSTSVTSTKLNRNVRPKQSEVYKLNISGLEQLLINAPKRNELQSRQALIISFPIAGSAMQEFKVIETPILHPTLAAKYPMIKTYTAQGIDDPTATMKISITQFGFHGIIFSGQHSTNYIDAYTYDRSTCIVYDRNSIQGQKRAFECLTDDPSEELPSLRNNVAGVLNDTDDQLLRTYRLALSCTAEYGNIFGTTPGSEKADIQAAMAISMNRVNGVYERDLAVTMEFIPNNDTIIYFGSTGADPWTNNWNSTTQTVIDTRVGSANYDIGHNFNTTGGGNAGCIACVCTNGSKGSAYTGSNNPVGDPFDIDYVAHEMGHQFGGFHTMNTCSRSGSGTTEVEAASGSSIMGYAGICGTNIQSNSDDDFNYVNVRDMSANVQPGGNSNCGFTAALINNPPTADAGLDYTIPKSTTYVLEGTATDADGLLSLTYNWSQNDPEQSPGNAAPQSTYAVGPLYRPLRPSISPNRYMPNINTIVSNSLANTWEVTPSVARTMDFSFIVRDNDLLGGQTASDLMTVTVDGSSGPFIVTSQGTVDTLFAGSSEIVTWNVAGTNSGAVNATNVDIFLSSDGGYTYPLVLATGVPNTGSANIIVPVVQTDSARIMVRGSGNIFFDINNANLRIESAPFVMAFSNVSTDICPPNDAVYNFVYNTYNSFGDTVTFSIANLPAGASATFNPTTAVNNGTPVTLTITGLTSANIGTFGISVTGTSATETKTNNISLNVINPSPSIAVLTTPVNGASGITSNTTLNWNASIDPGVTYDVDLATDASFTTIINSYTGLTTNSVAISGLLSSTEYFWRVRAFNICASAILSSTNSFTTNSCSVLPSVSVPVTVDPNGPNTVTSTLTISSTGTITDLNLVDLVGTHSYMSDLTFNLIGPTGISVELFGGICGMDDDYDLSLDDAAAPGAIPCPPIGSGTYQPANALSVFNGTDQQGVWTLEIVDGFNLDGGDLNGWGLELCTSSSVGIQNYSANSAISLYPNPTKDLVNLTVYSKSSDNAICTIVNYLGQAVAELNIKTNQNNELHVGNLVEGLYFMTINVDDKISSQKLMIKK